jgi:acetyl-CoA carboxylase biotin carboxyl carrier protein
MSLNYKDVAEIIKIIDASSCDELVVELGDTKIVVRRGGRGGEAALLSSAPAHRPASVAERAGGSPAKAGPKAAMRIEGGAGKVLVRSPMVGTFYRAPSPKDAPFVEIGSTVSIGDPLCVIEVMKLFTTITAERAGRVVSIFPQNAEFVEFDQPLFEIEPA